MKERPILFSGPMVRAIEEGRKTQTRRIVIPRQTTPRVPPVEMFPWMIDGHQEEYDDGRPLFVGRHPDYPTGEKWFACDYGKPGDRLWVRETWCLFPNNAPDGMGGGVYYRAGQNDPETSKAVMKNNGVRWRPSIHMPRKYSRITLEITGVRVERLQDIWMANRDKGSDCWNEFFAEGISQVIAWDGDGAMPTPLSIFIELWDSINNKRGCLWSTNPWVWVIQFRRVKL